MRLIDADALRESIITRQTEMSYEDAWALTCVDNAPTIEPDWTGLMVICDNCGHAIHVKRIDVKPTIEPQKWIPISVKLPEKRQDVIVTVNDGMIYTDTDEWIGTGFFAYGHNVVAWQSLPDPWKGEEE